MNSTKTDITKECQESKIIHIKISAMDKRMEQLRKLGFVETRVGMSNGTSTLLFIQIDEATKSEWEEFISVITEKLKTVS